MLNSTGVRGRVKGILEPPARGLLKMGVSPDAVTLAGTVGVVLLSVLLIARGQFLWALLVGVLVGPSDMLDGTMARLSGRSGPWGAFLDSTLDRIADGAVLGSLAYWYATQQQYWVCAVALLVVVGSLTVSYAKARAEGLGIECNVGFAERTERMLVVALGLLLTGLGIEWALPILLCVLALLVWFTVCQRMLHVRREARGMA